MRRFAPLATALSLLALAGASHASPADARYADDSEGVFWFLHISDLHTGTEMYPASSAHIALALGEARQVVRPWFTVATGDLVDASPFGVPTTGQDQGEWDLYKQLYTAAGVTLESYIDLPGNHDGYGDVGYAHYLGNSLLGTTRHALHASWTVATPAGEYYFHGLGSAGNGSGPFLEQPEFLADQIADLQTGLASHAAARLSFVLAHHPVTDPKNGSQIVDAMVGAGGGFYLHGHVHAYDEYTEGNGAIVVNEVDSLGKSDANNLAVGVVDHDAFVYRATSTSKPWPFVVITAPVSRSLRDGAPNPYAYQVCKDHAANPVRALVFAKDAIASATAKLGSLAPVAMAEDPATPELWSGHVDTTSLAAGPYDLVVEATAGAETVHQTIGIDLVDGPCEPFPDAGAADAGAGDAGPPDAAGSDAGGFADAAPADDAAPDAAPSADPIDAGADAGCACRATPSRATSPGSAGWLLALGAALVVRRRERSARG